MHPALFYDPSHLKTARQVLEDLGASPNKTLGQNFLVNGGALDHIVATSGLVEGDYALEIGPGLGALTVRLLQGGAKLTAIEKDLKFAAFLREKLAGTNLNLVTGDALDIPFGELGLPAAGTKLVANLPYSVSKPLLRHFFEEWRPQLSSLTVLVQREVANRLVARPDTSEYGPLSIMAHLWGHPRKAFDISPGSFFPPPQVVSTVVHVTVRQEPALPLHDEAAFWKVVRAAFGQRRKQLANTLSGLAPKAQLLAAFEATGIDARRRGETLSLQEFAALAEALLPV